MIWLLALIVVFVLIGGGVWGWLLVAGVLGAAGVKDKPSALENIVQLMRRYDISATDIETAMQASAESRQEVVHRNKGDVAKLLFIYLGAIFIFAGISAYVGLFWESMGSVMRVFMTLGVGYLLLIVLVAALHENKYPRLILPLALISALAVTGGWFVLIHEMFPQGDNWRLAVLAVFSVMAVQQGTLFEKYRLTVLAFTALFFVYGAMQMGLDLLGVPVAYTAIILGGSLLLVATALEGTPHRILSEPALLIGLFWLNAGLFDRVAMVTSANWASLIVGVCVILTAYGVHKEGRYPRLSGLGYLLGSIMAYSGLFDLVQNTPVELLYLAVTASALYFSVVLQSRAMLFVTVIAMLGFIGYYTGKYFADSLGWPVTLVLMGVAFLGVGTIAIKARQQI